MTSDREVQARHDLPAPDPAVAETSATLMALQRQRVFAIRSQQRIDRASESFIVRMLGYEAPGPGRAARVASGEETPAAAKARRALFSEARRIRLAVEKGGEDQESVAREGQSAPVLAATLPIILNSAKARAAWDDLRDSVEREMIRLAKTLPAWVWAQGVRGFGAKGLAIIVGEAGDLANYATVERLWKRLGLAVIDGDRQQRRSGKAEAAAHGFNPARRAEVWALADSFFRHQWRGAREDEGITAGPAGPYGEVYSRRKTATAVKIGQDGKPWSDGHRHADARRVMSKSLVEDLWRAWRNADAGAAVVAAVGGEGHYRGARDGRVGFALPAATPRPRAPRASRPKPAARSTIQREWHEWTRDECLAEAARFASREAWKKASGASYLAALRGGWTDECLAALAG